MVEISPRLGLNGDVIQSTIILKHLKKYRPEWIIDGYAGRGKHKAYIGLCRNVYHDQTDQPSNSDYKTVIEVAFWENYSRYSNKPNSKVTNCLQEVFGLEWDESLGRYECFVSEAAKKTAATYLKSIGCKYDELTKKFNAVIFHGQGNTSHEKKNLAHWQVSSLCELTIKAGRVPVILDWDRRSPLIDQQRVFNPGVHKDDIWGGFGSGDAEIIAALVTLSEAFVGIDSGPGKVASATETPTLICWTRHHPFQFHDPAPNTLHLIPDHHRTMSPIEGDAQMAEWFEAHYIHRTYGNGDHGLINSGRQWLGEVLGVHNETQAIQFVSPNGIGDVIWGLHKIKNIARGQPIDIILSGDPTSEIDRRSIPFLRRFPFVRSACVMDVPVLLDKENPTDGEGRYRYHPDGMDGCHHFLCPNGALERGVKLADWYPEYPLDWRVIDEFDWTNTERGRDEGKKLGKFVAFYVGPETGNVDEGHNRGFQWEPRHWNALGRWCMQQGCTVAVVGAPYDRSYWERYVRQGVSEEHMEWVDMIGAFPDIGDTFAFLKEARCLVSYQCGLGIVSHYMGMNVAMWWRRDGDSAHASRLVSFDERMASGWCNPLYYAQGKYLPLIYKRESVEEICYEIDSRKWLK